MMDLAEMDFGEMDFGVFQDGDMKDLDGDIDGLDPDSFFQEIQLDNVDETPADKKPNPKANNNKNKTTNKNSTTTSKPNGRTGAAPTLSRGNSSTAAAPPLRRVSSASSTKSKSKTTKSKAKSATDKKPAPARTASNKSKAAAKRRPSSTATKAQTAAQAAAHRQNEQTISNLRAIMHERKWSFATAAETIGVAKNPLQKWANGRAPTWGPRCNVEKWLAQPEQQATLTEIKSRQGQQPPNSKPPTKAQQARMQKQQTAQQRPAAVQRQTSTNSRASANRGRQMPPGNRGPVQRQNSRGGRQPATGGPPPATGGPPPPGGRPPATGAPPPPGRRTTGGPPGYYSSPPGVGDDELARAAMMAAGGPRGGTSRMPSEYNKYDPLPVNHPPGAYQRHGGAPPQYMGARPPHPGQRVPGHMGGHPNANGRGGAFGGLSAGIKRFTETLKRTTDASLHADIDQAVHSFILTNQQMMSMNTNPQELTRVRSKQSKMLLTRLQTICGEESIKAATEELKNLKRRQPSGPPTGGHPGQMGGHPVPGMRHAPMAPGHNNPNQDRHRAVAGQYARLIKAWNHACSCQDPNCSYQFCIKIKPSVQHQRDLKAKRMTGQCPPDCKDCGLYNKLCNFSSTQRTQAARQHQEMSRRQQGHVPHGHQSMHGVPPRYNHPNSHMGGAYGGDPRYANDPYQKTKQMSPLPYQPKQETPGTGMPPGRPGPGGAAYDADMSMVADILGGPDSGSGNSGGGSQAKRKKEMPSQQDIKKPRSNPAATGADTSADDWKNLANMFGGPGGADGGTNGGGGGGNTSASPARPTSQNQSGARSATRPASRPTTQAPGQNRPNPATTSGEKGKNGSGDRVTCVICHDADREILFLPCAHICTCGNCGNNNNIKTCPICRMSIDQKSFVYLS